MHVVVVNRQSLKQNMLAIYIFVCVGKILIVPGPLSPRGNDKKLPHLCRMCQLATTFGFFDT
jgi:hypothetical protein